MYKTGYDPSAMLSFFEKLQAKEKAKPGTMSSLFTDHPPTPDRIAAVKKEIETILPNLDQYLESTSEFDKVKAQVASLKNGTPDRNERKPVFKRQSPGSRPSAPDTESTDSSGTQTDDGPPPLKRKN
jgi:predicted Zn-dependent protease